MIYGVYQYWVHYNPGYHLGGRIAEDSKWQARWETLVFMPIQRYDAPSRKFGKIFVGILSVELDWVCSRKWNSERVVVLKSVILQHVQGVNNSTKTRKRILFQLDLWNCGEFDNLVKNTYNFAMKYTGRTCGSQTTEERHRTFSKLFLK